MRGWTVVAALVSVVLGAAPAVGADDARAVLGRVREYLAWYDRQLVTVVADEHYVQRAAPLERVLESEFGWFGIHGIEDTIGVREVLRVDGQTVTGAPRLHALLRDRGPDVSDEVRTILSVSATHNIGHLRRNINFPTFALAYLRRGLGGDTKWRAVRLGDHVDLRFEERERSALVRTPEGIRTPASGRFSVDPASGRIRTCELRVRLSGSASTYWMLVDFARHPRLDLWVPVRMLEYELPAGRLLRTGRAAGEATYSNYRRFETAGRLIR